MEKFYLLIVKDENGYTVVNHVANYQDDTIYIPNYEEHGLSQSEYRKSHHLTSEIAKNKPNWQVIEKFPAYEDLLA